MRAKGWIWVGLLAALAAFTGLRLVRGRAVQTDLLAMLPDTEKNPVAEQGLRSLAQALGDRAVFLVRGADPAASKAAASHLAEGLARSGAFAQVQATLPPIDPGNLVRFYIAHRFRVAAPEPGPAPSAPELAASLQGRLASPQSGFTGVGAAQDPLGDLERFLGALPVATQHFELQDDMLTITAPEGLYVLFTGGLRGSAFDPAVQKQVTRAVAGAERDLRQAFPGAEVLKTGTVFYAADARETAERETNLISSLSMLSIVVFFLAIFRSLRHLLLGLACVAAGLVLGAAVCLLIYGKLYLLTLVCGSTVMGVAVDYSFLYFAHHLGAGEAWEPGPTLRRLLPGILLGLFTTLLGYAALLVAPFPGLRQIAVFSLAGLAGSFLTVLLVVPDLLPRPIPARPRLFLAMDRLLRKAVALSRSRTVRLSLLLGGAVLALAALRTRADDDIRGLTQPSRPLQVQEARIQALTGMSNSACFILVEGQDEAQALAREEVLRQRLEGLIRPGGMEGLYALSSFVPSEARQEANLARNRERWPLLAGALRDSGFRPEAVAALQADLEASARQPLRLADFFQTTFSVPFRMLWLGPTGKGVATLVYPLGAPDSRALAQAASGLPGVTLVDKAQSVSSLLGHYRAIALWALGGAVVLVWLVLVLVYGLGAGTLVLGPALLGILASMAGLGLSGTPMSLFTALALILVLGFGVDYTVFLKEGGHRNPSSLLGVVLASLATMISYGLLVFSHTPALRGFGLTLGLGVLASTLLSFAALGHGREVTR